MSVELDERCMLQLGVPQNLKICGLDVPERGD
jgi:hypothetical protein